MTSKEETDTLEMRIQVMKAHQTLLLSTHEQLELYKDEVFQVTDKYTKMRQVVPTYIVKNILSLWLPQEGIWLFVIGQVRNRREKEGVRVNCQLFRYFLLAGVLVNGSHLLQQCEAEQVIFMVKLLLCQLFLTPLPERPQPILTAFGHNPHHPFIGSTELHLKRPARQGIVDIGADFLFDRLNIGFRAAVHFRQQNTPPFLVRIGKLEPEIKHPVRHNLDPLGLLTTPRISSAVVLFLAVFQETLSLSTL